MFCFFFIFSRSFRTQPFWSFVTGQRRDSGRFLPVQLLCRMCNQFTFHHQLRIDTWRSKCEQQIDIFLSTCGSMDKNHKDPDTINLEAPRLAQYMHQRGRKSEYGVLGRHQSCSEERIKVPSDTIERYHSSRNSPSLLYPESCFYENWRSHVRECICVTWSSSTDFPETWLDERIEFRSCLTTTTEKLFNNPKVPNQANQIQTQIMIERWNPLFAVTQVTRKVPPKHVPLMKTRTSMLKMKPIMIELGNPLFAVTLCNHLEVSNRANQFQTQVVTDRGNPLSKMTREPCKMEERRPVPRRSMQILFTKNLFLRTDRGNPLWRRAKPLHIHQMTVRVSTLNWHMIDRGNPLLKQTQKMCQMVAKRVLVMKA